MGRLWGNPWVDLGVDPRVDPGVDLLRGDRVRDPLLHPPATLLALPGSLDACGLLTPIFVDLLDHALVDEDALGSDDFALLDERAHHLAVLQGVDAEEPGCDPLVVWRRRSRVVHEHAKPAVKTLFLKGQSEAARPPIGRKEFRVRQAALRAAGSLPCFRGHDTTSSQPWRRVEMARKMRCSPFGGFVALARVSERTRSPVSRRESLSAVARHAWRSMSISSIGGEVAATAACATLVMTASEKRGRRRRRHAFGARALSAVRRCSRRRRRAARAWRFPPITRRWTCASSLSD